MKPMFTRWRKLGEVILDVGGPNEWDSYRVALADVIREPDGYKMYYSACNREMRWGIGLATSVDGLRFAKHQSNPLLRPGSCAWDGKEIVFSSTLREKNKYRMWFGMREAAPNEFYRLGYAESADGIRWQRHPGLIMDIGPKGSVDDRGCLRPAVIREGSGYRMVYASLDMDWHMQLCLATSRNGLDWEKHAGNPIVRPGPAAWDAVRIEDPHLVVLDGRYYLSYCGFDHERRYRIGMATSEDGVRFEKLPDPILDVGAAGSFDELFAAGSYIIKAEDGWRMYYLGRDAQFLERISVAFMED